MEAFLCQQAYREFKALSLFSPKRFQAGFLLGHTRGPRIYIEKIWPTKEGFKQAAKIYWDLERILGEEIVGFFIYSSSNRCLSSILKPFACGKILIEIDSNKNNPISLKCSVIDFSQSFRLLPCSLQLEVGGEA
ncbi:MAG: hypothetical protein N3B16_03070 [Candidatus Aminicenantes bacterium]|nr:hypothetical protein [Candidatus Aminicenantes bacterium]